MSNEEVNPFQEHATKAIHHLMDAGFAKNLDMFLRTFALAIAFALGTARAASENSITQEEVNNVLKTMLTLMQEASKNTAELVSGLEEIKKH